IAVFGHLNKSKVKWEGTRIAVSHGRFVINKCIPSNVMEYLIFRSDNEMRMLSNVSDKQQALISKTLKQDLDRLSKSDLFKDLENDVSIHGKRAFPEKK
ncbi:hypothetical protein, partial [Loktanella salsilacus]|uniref:hypothetical protein n=1 Tax=Loktanella salsilacus TaxID=195913 RepID=UPI0030014CC8